MVIVKADIIADVNDNLQTALSGTELDKAIIKTLADMSNRALLVGTDNSQSLAADDRTLDYPTGFRSVISITLTDASGSEKAPLIKLGHREYRELLENGSSTGKPEWFSEFNKKFYLWRPAGEVYTALIEYCKNHPKTADSIEFETEFESLMFAGATFWYAVKMNRSKSVQLWGAIYQNELKLAVAGRNVQPSIVRS